MSTAATRLDLMVCGVDDSVSGVRGLSLQAADRAPLPSFTPGSHLVVDVPVGPGRARGRANAYSLTGETLQPATYEVSVLRCDPEQGAGGGSAWLHGLAVGDRLTATPPRSAFAPVAGATRHLLVGAGIGITPLVSHLRSGVRWGRDMEVVYLFRDGHGAHVDDLEELGGDRVTFLGEREVCTDHLDRRLADQPIGTHLYVCGPAGFMDHVVGAARALGWPPSRVHVEAFGIDALDPGEPFTASVSGETFDVPSGVSLLDALLEHGHDVSHLCRQGVCGECRVVVRPAARTSVRHRDLFLSDTEKASGGCAMACVSRAEPDDAGAHPHLEVLL